MSYSIGDKANVRPKAGNLDLMMMDTSGDFSIFQAGVTTDSITFPPPTTEEEIVFISLLLSPS